MCLVDFVTNSTFDDMNVGVYDVVNNEVLTTNYDVNVEDRYWSREVVGIDLNKKLNQVYILIKGSKE